MATAWDTPRAFSAWEGGVDGARAAPLPEGVMQYPAAGAGAASAFPEQHVPFRQVGVGGLGVLRVSMVSCAAPWPRCRLSTPSLAPHLHTHAPPLP